ncbi:hypothetical protein BDN70DRAFT_290942 [Pholiota conissans]|uniref:F-box domain-containing protein n=1 Tax=Pholiota conissans TaxID=109636 RepID=A0A9P5ZB06_9AGAR|nr:hypothetical protein BDN70DRAFT_290942 [Pholiota conissans]
MSHSRRCGLCSYDKISCSPAFSSICDPCRKLAELGEKFEETRRMLIGFANERQKLKELANYKHDRIIHRLPVEIASNIFELCMPDSQDLMDLDPSHSTISAIPVQLVLSSVCRRWAAIAHSTSRLWTNLVLCANYLKRPWPNPILVEKWLNRSGNLGISIRLHVPDLFLRQYESTEIINVLNRYCDRWLHLTYQGPLFDLLKLGSADTDQPQLRRLRLTVSRPTSSTSEHQTLKLRPKTAGSGLPRWSLIGTN